MPTPKPGLSKTPDSLTQFGAAVAFHDISFLYASTPQPTGKVERKHQFRRKLVPAKFTSERIADVEEVNLRAHRNARDTHRELKLTAKRA